MVEALPIRAIFYRCSYRGLCWSKLINRPVSPRLIESPLSRLKRSVGNGPKRGSVRSKLSNINRIRYVNLNNSIK